MRSEIKTVTIALLSGCLLLPGTAQSAGDKPASSNAKRKAQRVVLRSRLATMRSNIHDTRLKLRKAKRSEESIASELHEIKSRLDATRARLQDTKARLTRTKQEQAKVAAALVESQNRLQNRELALAKRM